MKIFLRLLFVSYCLIGSLSLFGQAIAPFEDVLALINGPESDAIELLEKIGFEQTEKGYAEDCYSRTYSKDVDFGEATVLNYMICDEVLISVMINCDIEQLVEFEKGARAHSEFTLRYGNIGDESALIFDRADGLEVFIRKNLFLRSASVIFSMEPKFEYFKTNMEIQFERDASEELTLKMLDLVYIENSKGKTVEEVIKEFGPVEVPMDENFRKWVNEFMQTEQAEELRQLVKEEFLDNRKYVKRSTKLMEEIVEIGKKSPTIDGNPEMKLSQFLFDRDMMGSLLMFGYIFENHPFVKEMSNK